MANTKKLTPAQRKTAKREARRQTKARVAALTPAQRKTLRKHEGTLAEFLRGLDEKKEG